MKTQKQKQQKMKEIKQLDMIIRIKLTYELLYSCLLKTTVMN